MIARRGDGEQLLTVRPARSIAASVAREVLGLGAIGIPFLLWGVLQWSVSTDRTAGRLLGLMVACVVFLAVVAVLAVGYWLAVWVKLVPRGLIVSKAFRRDHVNIGPGTECLSWKPARGRRRFFVVADGHVVVHLDAGAWGQEQLAQLQEHCREAGGTARALTDVQGAPQFIRGWLNRRRRLIAIAMPLFLAVYITALFIALTPLIGH